MKKYYRALDHIIIAMQAVEKGNTLEVTSSLLMAAACPDFNEALSALNEVQASNSRAEAIASLVVAAEDESLDTKEIEDEIEPEDDADIQTSGDSTEDADSTGDDDEEEDTDLEDLDVEESAKNCMSETEGDDLEDLDEDSTIDDLD